MNSSLLYRDNQKFCKKASVLVAQFEEGGVAFDLESRNCCKLNSTALLLLSLVDGNKSMRDVFQSFAKKCDQPEENIRNDFRRCFEDLINGGWVDAK